MSQGEKTGGRVAGTPNNRLWADTIKRAALAEDGKKLRQLADSLFDKAVGGDVAAIREIGDRLDGKPAQTIGGDKENPLFPGFDKLVREIVDAKHPNP